MADSQSILQLGIEAARAGDKAEARELFRLVTREDPGNAQGWLWLAGVAEDREEKRVALERVMQIDPTNELARKGLAALGGGAAARTAAPAVPVAPPTETPPLAQPAAASVSPMGAADVAPAGRGRARVYSQPEQASRYAPPDFGDDDYDLSEYQAQPQTALDDAADRDRDTVVVVEDEEPRRRGFAAFWPLLLLGLLTLGVLVFLLARNFGGDNRVAVDPNASAGTVGAESSAASVDGGAAGAVASAASDATGLLASPSADATGNASGAAGTEGSPATGAEGSAPATGADVSAAPVPSGDAGQASAPADVTASAPADAAASAPAGGVASPAAASQPPAPAPSPTAVPAPSAAPAPPADVATANPAIVGNEQVLRAGNFEYSFSTGLSNVATGSYGGAPPARGRYLIVLMTVRNVGPSPAQIPDGFFVVKDAQGRVSDFNRAASVDYINRFGGPGPRGAGDFAADAALAPGGQLASMPLLFDVASDATNLVIFSRDNMAQGFLARQNAQ